MQTTMQAIARRADRCAQVHATVHATVQGASGAAPPLPARRRWMALAALGTFGRAARADEVAHSATLNVFTFGDSVLDCARYNEQGVHPGQLLVRNEDALFPEFRGRDLQSRGPAQLMHRALDGATVSGLPAQASALAPPRGPAVALLTIGGNDLIAGLAADRGPGLKAFEAALEAFLQSLPIRPVLMGTVYDPTFGDDARNFLPVDARTARANHRRVNEVIGTLASRHGRLVDLHAHFLEGSPAWFTRTIEPSLIGASEVRRVFLHAMSPR